MAAVGTSNGWFASSLREREQRLEKREQRLGGMDGPLLHLAERIQEYTVDYAQTKVVSKLADEYGFDYQEAIRFLNGERTVPKEVVEEPLLVPFAPLPWQCIDNGTPVVKVTEAPEQVKPTQEAPEQVQGDQGGQAYSSSIRPYPCCRR